MLLLLLAIARVGLYPVSLPEGIAAQLHDGAAALPGVKAFDVIAHGACAADEIDCLADSARRAGVDTMLAASVTGSYRYVLRAVSSQGKLLGERRGEVSGDLQDLGGALERDVCEVLGAAPCEGYILSGGILSHVPIGMHTAGGERVRVSYGRTVRIGAPVPLQAVSASVLPQPRATAGKAMLATGVLLLAGAVATQAFTHSAPLPSMLAATGAGAVVASGLLFSLSGSF